MTTTVKIRVLKPFMFTHSAIESERLTTETRFVPGIYDVSEDIANHPWIKAGADGKIESETQRQVREVEEKARRELVAEDDARATANAEAAIARIAAAEATVSTATKEEIEAELNTPVNALRKKNHEEIDAELNTPVSSLRKKGYGAGVTAKP